MARTKQGMKEARRKRQREEAEQQQQQQQQPQPQPQLVPIEPQSDEQTTGKLDIV